MRAFSAAFAVFGLGIVAVSALYAVSVVVSVQRDPLPVKPFMAGGDVFEHAVSRYHPRGYVVSLMLLAFDMEMLFMYPWTLVVRVMGSSSVIEMFTFLALLVAGVVYAAREGAFRWS